MANSLIGVSPYRCVHNELISYMLDIMIAIDCARRGRDCFIKLDGHILAMLPKHIEDISVCDQNLHKEVIDFLGWLMDNLTNHDWQDKLDYDRAYKWFELSKSLEKCQEYYRPYRY